MLRLRVERSAGVDLSLGSPIRPTNTSALSFTEGGRGRGRGRRSGRGKGAGKRERARARARESGNERMREARGERGERRERESKERR
eukprot:2982803-Pleurochrysis_carterae.AAC.1